MKDLSKLFPIMEKKDWLEYLKSKKTKVEIIKDLANKDDGEKKF